MKEEIKTSQNFCGVYYVIMVGVNRKTDERNGVETIVDGDGILWLNEKHLEEGLGHKNLRVTRLKYPSGYRKHIYELVDGSKKQPNRIFIPKELAK